MIANMEIIYTVNIVIICDKYYLTKSMGSYNISLNIKTFKIQAVIRAVINDRDIR